MVVLRVNKKIPHRGKYFGGLDVFLRRPDSLTESPGLIQYVALPVPLSKPTLRRWCRWRKTGYQTTSNVRSRSGKQRVCSTGWLRRSTRCWRRRRRRNDVMVADQTQVLQSGQVLEMDQTRPCDLGPRQIHTLQSGQALEMLQPGVRETIERCRCKPAHIAVTHSLAWAAEARRPAKRRAGPRVCATDGGCLGRRRGRGVAQPTVAGRDDGAEGADLLK